MFVVQILTASKNCFNGEGVWSFIDVRGLTVVDFGVGESTYRLIDLGADVIVVDIDAEKLRRHVDLGADLIRCDITDLPFDRRVADLAVFYFTLHEIDPVKHREIVSTARRIASKILVVEPSPEGCRAYRRYAELWREAMHSIGRFEEYKPASYWTGLVEGCGFKITVLKKIKQNKALSPSELKEIVDHAIKEWVKLSVEDKYIDGMRSFLSYAKKNGMKWSDLTVIIGEGGLHKHFNYRF